MLEQTLTKPAKEFPITTSLVATAAILFTGSKLLRKPLKRSWDFLFGAVAEKKVKQKRKYKRRKSSKAKAA
jgi:hypothetical protein